MATISKAAKRRQAEADSARQKALRAERAREEQITRLIEETGWAVCVADSDDPSDPAPHFGYTIGLSARGKPELCAWGHDRSDLQTTLNLVANVLEKRGETVQPGDTVTLPGVAAWGTLPVPDAVLAYLEYARRRYTFVRAVRVTRVL